MSFDLQPVDLILLRSFSGMLVLSIVGLVITFLAMTYLCWADYVRDGWGPGLSLSTLLLSVVFLILTLGVVTALKLGGSV